MESTTDRLIKMIESRGWRGRIVPIAWLADLRRAICDRYERGLIDAELYRDQLGFLRFEPPTELPAPKSIIIAASPTPQMRLTFHRQGKTVPVVVPPTYVKYTARTREAQTALREWLSREGHGLADAPLPLKTLAVASGLARYGRSNITYVPGMGSFYQLVGAFSDLPARPEAYGEPKALDRCASCVACIKRCPTGAISRDRFLIHAERCLTYHNEAAADFPDWIDASWHHCLVGCMRCQTVCPENRKVIGWFEDRAEFSEEETALMVKGEPLERLPREAAARLKSLEINEDYRLLCRNLAMIIDKEPDGLKA